MTTRTLRSGPFYRFICVTLAIAMATGPSAAAMAQRPAGETPTVEVPTAEQPIKLTQARERTRGDMTLLAAPQAGKIDLSYVTPQAVFLLVMRPNQVLRAPGSELLPVEVFAAAGLEHLGFDPADVSEITVFVEPPMGFQPRFGVAVKFAQPFDISQLPEKLSAHTQPGDLAGQRYMQSAHPQLPSMYMPNDRTLLVAPDVTLRQMLAVNELEQHSPLVDRVRGVAGVSELYAVVDVASLRPLITPLINMAVMQQGDKFPEEAKPFLEAPDLVSGAELTINLMSAGPNSLVIHAEDTAGADRLEELIYIAYEMQRQKMEAEMVKLAESEDPIHRAVAQYVRRLSDASAASFRPVREDDSLVLFRMTAAERREQQTLVMVAVFGTLVALLLLPAVRAARAAARRNQSMNNMKQLMLSLHIYHDAKRSFPAHASYDADGKPLLSWRVHILPYLDEKPLYDQFKLDEPWDSPHNRQLIARMPDVFGNPNLTADDGKTNYLAVVGKECVFDGTAKGMRMANIADGVGQTITLVGADADQAVIWTKPDDWEYDADNPTAGLGGLRPGLGGLRPGGWNAAFADGRVSFIENNVDKEVLKSLFTRAGGEMVEIP